MKHKNVCEKISACVFLRGAVLINIFDVLSDIKENKYFMQKILDNFWCQTNIYSKKKKPTDFWYLIKSISEYQMFTFFFIYQKKFPDIRKKTFFDKA